MSKDCELFKALPSQAYLFRVPINRINQSKNDKRKIIIKPDKKILGFVKFALVTYITRKVWLNCFLSKNRIFPVYLNVSISKIN